MRRRLHRFALALLASSAALAIASTSRADDPELAGLLDENVVTTASKASELGSTAPATSSVITAEQMRAYGIHTIGEAIDFLGLGATGASKSSGGGFGVRGVHLEGGSEDKVLLLVDGHAVNDFNWGAAPLGYDTGIPLELIDHIELVLGPGSVLYGSNATLGVVNVITKRANAFRGVRVGVESDVPFSARGFAGVGHEFLVLGAPSELTVAVQYRRANGPHLFYAAQDTGIDPATGKPTRWADQPAAATGIWGGRRTQNDFAETPSLYARFVSGNFEATFRAMSDKSVLPFGLSHFDDPTSRSITRRISGELRHHASLSAIVQINTRLYADGVDQQEYLESSVGHLCTHQDEGCVFANISRARWAGVEVQSTFDWLKDGTFVTLAGVDPRLRSGQGKTDTFSAETGAPLEKSVGIIDRTDVVVGAYLQQTWKPFAWLAINGGMRLDYDERFNPVISPRLAVSANVWRGGVLKAVYAEAFNAPSFNESYFTHPLQPLSDLRPESVRSAELSIEQKLGAQRLLFGVFRSTWTDLVELHYFTPAEAADYVQSGKSTIPPLTQFQNTDRIENYGFNAGFEGSVAAGRLRYGANVTGAVSYAYNHGNPAEVLSTSPRTFGNARISYALPNGLPTIGVAGLYAAKRPVAGAYDGNYPTPPYAPAQIALRTTLSGDAPWVKGLSYRISANYQFTDTTTQVVGPLTQYSASHPFPNLEPAKQFVTTVGLQYEF